MKQNGLLVSLLIAIVILNLVLLGLVIKSKGPGGENRPGEILVGTAGVLKERGFHAQAAELYRQILLSPEVPMEEKGNVAFMLAELELNELDDPESSYAHYEMASGIVQSGDLLKEIQKGKVAALERTGRSIAATRALGTATDLVEKQERQGKPLARIGKEEIYEPEVKKQLDLMPERIKARFRDEEGFREYVRQYVASRLLLDAAKRAGLDRDPRVLEQMASLKDEVLQNAYMERELQGKLNVTELDAREYYRKNQDQFKDSESGNITPFEQVKDTCLRVVEFQKRTEITNNVLNRLVEAADVEFYEEK